MEVSIAKGFGLDGRGSIHGRARDYLLHNVHTGSEVYPVSYAVVSGAASLWVKQSEGETHLLRPSNAEVKNGGCIPPLPRTSSLCSA